MRRTVFEHTKEKHLRLKDAGGYQETTLEDS